MKTEIYTCLSQESEHDQRKDKDPENQKVYRDDSQEEKNFGQSAIRKFIDFKLKSEIYNKDH